MSANFDALLKPPRARFNAVIVMMAVMPRGEIHDGTKYTGASRLRQGMGACSSSSFHFL